MVTDRFSDPNELFDVCDSLGRPTGQVKRRAEVHRDGDWHRSLHCWVLMEHTPDGAPRSLLYQRRGAHKDTWPGRLDVSVGGHFGHDETLGDVIREVEEEIGQRVQPHDLLPLGRRVSVNEQEPGTRDREIQEIYLWRSALPLDAYRPQPIEVTALERAAVDDVLALFGRQVARIPVDRLLPDGTRQPGTIALDDFIPSLDGYFHRVAVMADLAGRCYPHLLV